MEKLDACHSYGSVKEFEIYIYQIVGPVPKPVEFSLKETKSSNRHCSQMLQVR